MIDFGVRNTLMLLLVVASMRCGVRAAGAGIGRDGVCRLGLR